MYWSKGLYVRLSPHFSITTRGLDCYFPIQIKEQTLLTPKYDCELREVHKIFREPIDSTEARKSVLKYMLKSR